jgi:hypothetical protein
MIMRIIFQISRVWFSASVCALLFLVYFTDPAHAQWETPQSLVDGTDSSLTSPRNARCLVVNGEVVHVAWEDNRNGYWQVFYKRSTDGGVTWSRDFPCSSDVNHRDSHWPAMAVSGETVHLVWHGARDGYDEIYYRRSTNAGTGWKSVQRLTYDPAVSRYPSIAVNGDMIHVAWSDGRPGTYFAAYYMKSMDGGETWQYERRMTAEHLTAFTAQVSVEGSSVYLSWYYFGGGTLVFNSYLHSTDGGESWGEECKILEDPLIINGGLNIQQCGSHVYMLWCDERTGSFDLYCRHSSDGGVTWSSDIPFLNRQLNYIYPVIAVRGSVVYLAFVDDTNGLGLVQYSQSTNFGVDWSEWDDISSYESAGQFPHLALGENAVHVLWTDIQDGNANLMYRRNPTGAVTTVEQAECVFPSGISLSPGYPNPCMSSCTMGYSLQVDGHVRITLHDLLGRELQTLIEDRRDAGSYTLRIDGNQLPVGSYLIRMQAATEVKSQVITVLQQ